MRLLQFHAVGGVVGNNLVKKQRHLSLHVEN